MANIIKKVAFNKTILSTSNYFTKHANITTKLKLKFFRKVIKKSSKGAWV
jgi:hypothetical protein